MYNFKFHIKLNGLLHSDATCLVVFLIDDKNLNEELVLLEKSISIKLSVFQRKSFLDLKVKELFYYDNEDRYGVVILQKVKVDSELSNDFFRNYFSFVINDSRIQNIKSLQVLLPNFSTFKAYFSSEEYFYQTFVEGLYLGNFKFDNYKSEKEKEKKLDVYFCSSKKNISKSITNASAIMEGVYIARQFANEPAIIITPNELGLRTKAVSLKYGIKTTIFNEHELKKRKMGGVTAVGMGSNNPPRFIILHYKPKIKSRKKIVLAGKGVTFDSGGISIKPSSNMGEMKADMSGAAAVIGTMISSAKARLPIELIGLIPAVENMPSGKSFRPGDIIKTASGKSIEVDNTDAEGRIILADTLEYASKLKPDSIIDLATLTGAVVVALGEYTAGLFSKDEKLAKDIYQAGLNTFERVWRLPLWDEYNQLIKSDIADVKNTGGLWGGAITAAKFLEKFVAKDIPWIHLDIAGPAIYHDLNNYTKKYMTGFGVRLLFEYLSSIK